MKHGKETNLTVQFEKPGQSPGKLEKKAEKKANRENRLSA